MRFSILTCSYNSLEGLRDAVAEVRRSSAAPTVKPVEIEHIIIDGGSTDGTLRLAELAQDYAEVPGYELKWISEPDQGLYDALNKGMRMATGDVIGILHTDDVWEVDTLTRVAWSMEQGAGSMGHGAGGRGEDKYERSTSNIEHPTSNDSDLRPLTSDLHPEGVYGDLLYVDADDITKVKRVWKSGSYDKLKWYNGWMPPHPALFVTRELVERVGEYRLDLGSAADYEWMLRAGLVHDARFLHLPQTLVRMRVGGQSNASTKARLKANASDRRAWEVNGLKPKPWTLWMKPIRKVPQWVWAVVRWSPS